MINVNKFSVTSLQSNLEKLRSLQEKREESFTEKSDKWQESEKGEAFEYRTSELEGLIEDLENAIDAIESWNDEG